MDDFYPKHPVTYRQEILAPVFRLIAQGESCLIVGAASMAKSNLASFLLRPDVQKYYLEAAADHTLVVLYDTNRLARLSHLSQLEIFELLLDCLTAGVRSLSSERELAEELSKLHRTVVMDKDELLALRYTERAIRELCLDRGLRVVILIDEADRLYSTADSRIFDNLRAIRDNPGYKYKLCYVMMTRTLLERLRETSEVETFYELFSRNTLGLKPLQDRDARRVIEQLEARKAHALTDCGREILLRECGGHPGLLVGGFDALAHRKDHDRDPDTEWLLANGKVREECRKLWASLGEDEQWTLIRTRAGLVDIVETESQKLLVLKGLIIPGKADVWQVFSPVFTNYVREVGAEGIYQFRVVDESKSVWVAGQEISNLSRLEFNLVKFLADHRGKVQSREEILRALYPEEFRDDSLPDIQDNRVDTTIRRVRQKLEPASGDWRYILTVTGHGYKLATGSDTEPN